MFYVMRFDTHTFKSCNTDNDAIAALKELEAEGVPASEIEVINGFIDEARMSVDEFHAEYGA